MLRGGLLLAPLVVAGQPVEIGSRLELFVDDALIEELRGEARLELHKPVPGEVVLVTDRPWEGNTCAYYTILRDGDRFRMYYRGSHFDEKARRPAHREVTCYAESADGIHWSRPELGLFEFDGSKKNNIVWDGPGAHNFTPFLDTNPECRPEARFKALGRGAGESRKSLLAFQSPDGIHWRLMRAEPVITKGAFDSQNLAFWDPLRRCYVEYHREFRDGVRDIMTSASADFLHWSEPEFLRYLGAPREHLYTNAILPYERAPHIYIGFPTRFLPERSEQVEPTFMTSRDGRTFRRWTEALIPVTAPEDRDGNRSNYLAWGLVRLPGDDRYSVYATEAYYSGPASRLRRFTYRIDGFVSVRASEGGEVLTKALRFSGKRLVINFAASTEGSVQVELRDDDGAPLRGYRLAECPAIRGDAIEHTVLWQGGADVSPLAGRSVRILFKLKGADLYSFRFAE